MVNLLVNQRIFFCFMGNRKTLSVSLLHKLHSVTQICRETCRLNSISYLLLQSWHTADEIGKLVNGLSTVMPLCTPVKDLITLSVALLARAGEYHE